MWFDIIKNNKRTKYYREFLEAATQLGDLIDSPDNIKAYENFSGDKRPNYNERGTAVLYAYDFQFTAIASFEQPLLFYKKGDLKFGVIQTPEYKKYNLFINQMFKTEYPELHNKIWEFALFYNKIVNPNLLGREADKQRALFEGSSTNLFEDNLVNIYKFINSFLKIIREKTFSTLLSPSSFSSLPEKRKDRLRRIIDPTSVLVPKKNFINRLTHPIIEDATGSAGFILYNVLDRTYLKTLTDYIKENWKTIINTLRTDGAVGVLLNTPNIKTLQLRYKNPKGTEFYNQWLAMHQRLHEEEIEKYIEEMKNIPEEDFNAYDNLFVEEDLGNWEDNEDDIHNLFS